MVYALLCIVPFYRTARSTVGPEHMINDDLYFTIIKNEIYLTEIKIA